MVDVPQPVGDIHFDSAMNLLAVSTRNNGGVPAGWAAYYVVRPALKITRFEVKEAQGKRVALLYFDAVSDRPLEVRCGTSFISQEQALKNLNLEIGETASRSRNRRRGKDHVPHVRPAGNITILSAGRLFYAVCHCGPLYSRICRANHETPSPLKAIFDSDRPPHLW